MGCGCGKGQKNTMPRRVSLRPTVGPRPIQGGLAAGPTPTEIRAFGMQTNVSVGETQRMDQQRLRLEKLRREAIQRRLNK